jgi:ketosteroid isomerase-like protein
VVERSSVPSTLHAFLDRYRRALAAEDVGALAELVHVPCLILGPQVHAVLAADELRHALSEQLRQQREIGVTKVEFEVLGHRRIEARYLTVDVSWEMTGAGEDNVWEFSVMYTLTAPERGWKIVTVAPLEPALTVANPTGSHAIPPQLLARGT